VNPLQKGFPKNFLFLESLGFSFEKFAKKKITGVKRFLYAITLTFGLFLQDPVFSAFLQSHFSYVWGRGIV